MGSGLGINSDTQVCQPKELTLKVSGNLEIKTLTVLVKVTLGMVRQLICKNEIYTDLQNENITVSDIINQCLKVWPRNQDNGSTD